MSALIVFHHTDGGLPTDATAHCVYRIARGVTTIIEPAKQNLHQFLSEQQKKLTSTNTGLFIPLQDINYLYSAEIEEIVTAHDHE